MPRKTVIDLDQEFSAPQVRQACGRVEDYARRAAVVLRRFSSDARQEAVSKSETLRSLLRLRETLDEVAT